MQEQVATPLCSAICGCSGLHDTSLWLEINKALSSTSFSQTVSPGSVCPAICLSQWTRSSNTSQIDVLSIGDKSTPKNGAIHFDTCSTTVARRRKGVHQVTMSGLWFHQLINKDTAIMLDGTRPPEGNSTPSLGQSRESNTSTASQIHNEPDVSIEGAGGFLDINDFFQGAIPSTSVGTKPSRDNLEYRGSERSYVNVSSPARGSPPVTVMEQSENHTDEATPMCFISKTSQG